MVKNNNEYKCNRQECNLKAQMLLESKNYDEAEKILCKMIPYELFDENDLETLRLLGELFEKKHKTIESQIYKNSFNYYDLNDEQRKIWLQTRDSDMEELYLNFIENSSEELINCLIIENLKLLKVTEASLFYKYAIKNNININQEIVDLFNNRFKYAKEFINDLEIKEIFECCIIVDPSLFEQQKHKALAVLLSKLGLKISYVCPENSSGLDLDGINFYKYNDVAQIENIIRDIEIKLDNACYVFGDESFMYSLYSKNRMYSLFEMFYQHYEKLGQASWNCLLLGSFNKIAKFLYNIDIDEFFADKVYDYSIVIPARNSARYLKAAIETCLNQRFIGSYEIVISDNSDIDNSEVKQLVDCFSDNRINYYKTPFVLPLSKSFEFAYLKTKGKRILSLGSDDGLVPICLSTLNRIYDECNNNIIHFSGFSYSWPSNYSQGVLSHGFENFDSDKISKSVKTSEIIRDCLSGKYPFQSLPILYMHTCITKEYIKNIIDLTGKFEFGMSQDVYTGVLGLMIEETITYTKLPLLIGGASPIGIGRVYNTAGAGKEYYLYKGLYQSYRYSNYYKKGCHASHPPMVFSKNEGLFIFSEFFKIKELGILSTDINYDIFDFNSIVRSSYLLYPRDTTDINILRSLMHDCCKYSMPQFYEEFKLDEKKYISEIFADNETVSKKIKKKIKGAVKDKKVLFIIIKYLNSNISYIKIKLAKFKHTIKQCNTNSSIPTKAYCDYYKKNIKDVNKAAQEAMKYINKEFNLG